MRNYSLKEILYKLQKNLWKPRYNMHIFPALILLMGLFAITFKLHRSSIGIYHTFLYGDTKKDENLLIGKPRDIRSDEFLVISPWMISQSEKREVYNPNIGEGQNLTILPNIPTKHWTTVFKPFSWSYFILPTDFAFSCNWILRDVLLLISGYYFFYILSKKKVFLAIAASVLFYLSPFIQWWFSTGSTDLCIFTFSFLTILQIFFDTENTLRRIIHISLLSFFSLCYLFVLYPPFQIPLVFLILFYTLGLLLNKNYFSNKKKIFSLIGPLVLYFALTGFIAYLYFKSNEKIIAIIQNTSYPGGRIASGGELNPLLLLNYYYNIFFNFSSKNFPTIFGNQSEGSNFLLVGLFTLPFSIFYIMKSIIRKKKVAPLFITLTIFVTLLLLWQIAGLSPFLEKISLLNRVPVSRGLIAVGLSSFMLFVLFITRLEIKINRYYKILSIFVCLSIAAFYLYYGQILYESYPSFISTHMLILLISSIIFVSTFLIYIKKISLSFFILLLYSLISAGLVNPIYKGISLITETEITRAVKEIDKENKGNKAWVVYDSIIWGNYLVSNNIKMLSTTYYYPNLTQWEKIDPQKKFADTYNRYAHVIFIDEKENTNKFNLIHLDTFSVNVDPCSKEADLLGIGYVILLEKKDYSCLSLIKDINYPNVSFYIYQKVN